MKTCNPKARLTLPITTRRHLLTLAGATILGSSSAFAATWNGTVNTDWNHIPNWSAVDGGSGTITISTSATNIATITANISPIPTSMLIGVSAAARIDHRAGNASMATGGDLTLGRGAGGNGTYNLANTGATGGALTGFGVGSGNFTIPRNAIVGGVVGPGVGTININTTGTLSIAGQLLVGNQTTGLPGTGTIKIDSGTLTVANEMEIGNGTGGNGTFRMSGGTVTKTGAGTAVTIGGGVSTDGGIGTADLNGGTFTVAGDFRIGQDLVGGSATTSTGTVNLGGTNLTVNGGLWVGNNTGATGTLNFSNGTITSNNWVSVGRKEDANSGTGATGTVTMTDGTWIKNGESNFIVGDTGTGTMNMSGGLVIVNPHPTANRGLTWVGNRGPGNGILTISGTAEFRSPRFMAGVEGGTVGTINLNGGTVKTGGFSGGVGDGHINFNGTQIIATGDSESFIETFITATIGTGGLKVDTAGFNVSSFQGFEGTGGVTKSGAGTLTLTGSSSFTGANVVNGGKLAVASDMTGPGSFTVASGAELRIDQANNFSSLAAPSVTMAGGSSLSIAFPEVFGNPESPALAISGGLTLSGPVTLNISDINPELGPTIPLITYTGAIAGGGSFVLGSLPIGVKGTLVQTAGAVSLNITSINFPLWRGTTAIWDTTTSNWIDRITEDPMTYSDPLPAEFDDDPSVTNTAITLNQTVTPGLVTFDNDDFAYSLGGTGKISGHGGLTKIGGAALDLNLTNNDYTGVTTLSGGTTTVSVLGNSGVASSLGAPSTSPEKLDFNGGTLVYTGGNVTTDRGFTVSGSDSGISHASNVTFTGRVAGKDGGSFIKNGAGTLTLSGSSITLGGAGLPSQVQAGTLAFPGPSQTISIPGELYVGSVPNAPAHLVLTNSSLSVGNFLALGRGNGDTGVLSTITATGSTVRVGSFSTGFDNLLPTNDSDQTVTLTNTNWTTTGTTLLAEKQNSTTNMTLAGNSTYTATNTIQMAINNTAVCNFTLQDTSSLTHSGGWFSIGNDGIATITVKNNASLSTVNADFNISDVGTSTGFVNIQDNGSVSATGIVFVGKNAGTTGTVNISGGTFNSATYVTIGRRTGATGHFNITGGTVNQTGAGAGFIVGENGTGTLTVSGTGVLNVNGGGLYLSAEAVGTSNSVAHLNAGGTIIAKRVVQRDFNSANYTEFRFNGGLLKAQTGSSTDFMNSHDLVSVDAGGAFIDSNGQNITISQVLVGPGSMTKQGTGTLTLSGANSYSGNTTVSAGTLTASSAFLSNSGTVSIASGAVLNLPHGQVDQVASLVLNGVVQPVGTYTSSTPGGYITGVGSLQVTGAVTSPYDAWMAGFPSIPVADRDPGDDPDGDGATNAMEFALGGTPNTGSSRPKVYNLIADSSADGDTSNELLLTIAVRSGTPAFAGSPSPTATHEGYTYTVQGSANLTGFTTAAAAVTPVTAGLPAVPSGYEYRTFSLTGSNGTPSKGFLRVAVTP